MIAIIGAVYAVLMALFVAWAGYVINKLQRDVDYLKHKRLEEVHPALTGVKGTGRLTWQTKRGLIDLDLNRLGDYTRHADPST